jgi:hypothetical protein
VAIDFAGDLADCLEADDLPEVTGTVTRDGEEVEFEGGRILSEAREARRGNTDERRRTLLIPATGIASAPRAKAYVTFTGDDATWVVMDSEPLAPGGTTIAWRLTLVDVVDR